MKEKIAIALNLLTLNLSAYAVNKPEAFPTDARIKQVYYQENNVIPIRGVILTSTQILFPEDERVLDIEGGDSTAWMVTFHSNIPNMVFVKPTVLNSNSNMTIVTNRHPYYFHLTSNQNLNPNPKEQTYAIHVLSKKSVSKSLSQHVDVIKTKPKARNWNYRFSGSPQLVPLHVFDDGQFTYFELAANAAVPAIFAVEDSKGKEMTVNTRRDGKYLVVQRIAPQFTLRQGSQVTSVFNTQEIKRIQQNERPKS